jgi:hypothetical protein
LPGFHVLVPAGRDDDFEMWRYSCVGLVFVAACLPAARITAVGSGPRTVGQPIKITATWDRQCTDWSGMLDDAFDLAKDAPPVKWETESCEQRPFRLDVQCSLRCEHLVGAGIGKAETTVIPLEPGVLWATVVATRTDLPRIEHEVAVDLGVVVAR